MSKVFSVQQIAELDKYTIEHEPIPSIDLMERASDQLFEWIIGRFPYQPICIFVGPGNNGGDGLALARMLLHARLDVNVYLVNLSGKFSVDAQTNLDRLRKMNDSAVHTLDAQESLWPVIEGDVLIVDALFGSGLNRPLSGFPASIVAWINSVDATVVSVDMPSGLFGEDNRMNDQAAIIQADYTLCFQFPKLAFFMADCDPFVGEWEVLDIQLHPKGIDEIETNWNFVDSGMIKNILKKRGKFSHKGHYGHALLMAGSYGKFGAAVLAARACLKAGVGLLTVQIPHMGYQVVQTAVPEAMVSIDRSDILISEFPNLSTFNAIGAGPGIGCKSNTREALKNLFSLIENQSLVLDADALNILSECPDLQTVLPSKSILTPHPREFDRLSGTSTGSFERFLKAQDFAKKNGVVVVLKGAYTMTALPDGSCYFNATGNPGMATAGSGDVLTGIILGLLSQGYTVEEAAILGVYLHGLSGDLAAEHESYEGVTASEIINYLGPAFLHAHAY